MEFAAALALVFLVGLLGGPHCALMCGPIAHPALGSWRARGVYHGGRLLTYLGLGLVAASVGEAFWRLLQSQVPSGVALGLFVGAYGLLIVFTGSEGGYPARFRRWLRPWVERWGREGGALSLGLVTGLLPCGWLYTFVLAASSYPTPLHGAALMSVFWLSTVPWVDAAGRVLARVGRAGFQRPGARAAFLCVILGLGLVLKFSGLHPTPLSGRRVLDHVARPEGLIQQGDGAQDLICR